MLIADLVLVSHALVVIFNVGGLVVIYVGGPLGWAWVRHRGFRIAHLSLMGLVTVEAIFGLTCPLTSLEDWLRGVATDQSFVSRWVTALIYWSAPPWIFAVLYALVLSALILAWFAWPPGTSKRNSAHG